MRISYSQAGALAGALLVLLIVTIGFYSTLLVLAGGVVGYFVGQVLQGKVEIRVNSGSGASRV
jgi:uncharacterized membrane protein